MKLSWLLALLASSPFAFFALPVHAATQTITATHTYILGDHDSKDDARQRCLLEAKRKILEQAGVYIESASEVKNFDLTKDKITSFAAAVMQVTDTKEEVSFQQGHMTMTLTITATVDLVEVRKQMAAQQVDEGVRDTVATQQERLKRLEAQLGVMQRQQGGQSSEHAPASSPSDISAEEVERWHTQAAQGYAVAQTLLGMMYEEGVGVPVDYPQARQWYEKAAVQGQAEAQSRLGILYYLGHGVPKDYVTARKWWDQAAVQGNAEGQYRIGLMYGSGKGAPQDYSQARQWFEKAAAQGHAKAQSLLGALYANGDGVPQDYVKAAQWYEQAAARGNAEAQTRLGRLYSAGVGVHKDSVMAGQWLEKAAVQGNTEAQTVLGVLYATGHGVRQDYVRAYMWFSLAEVHSTGDEQKLAVDARGPVARSMTPAQIAEAQRLAQQCQAQQFKGC